MINGNVLLVGEFKTIIKSVRTMAASSWAGRSYSFESIYPVAEYDITIEPSSTITETQYKAFAKAMICGSPVSNVFNSVGTVPTIDIPVIVTAVPK